MSAGGAVSCTLDNTGIIGFAGDDADGILEYLVEKDADVHDVVEEDGQITAYTRPGDLHRIQEALKKKDIGELAITELGTVPQDEVTLKGDDLAGFEKVLGILKDLEDVRKAHHNVDLPK